MQKWIRVKLQDKTANVITPCSATVEHNPLGQKPPWTRIIYHVMHVVTLSYADIDMSHSLLPLYPEVCTVICERRKTPSGSVLIKSVLLGVADSF